MLRASVVLPALVLLPSAAVLLSAPVLLSAAELWAQQAPPAGARLVLDPARLHGLRYRMIGPTRGGRVTAVAGHRSQPFTFCMGATGGGVWKTEDAGITWRNVSDGHFHTGSIGAIAVAESDPDVVYVGTGSDGLRSNVIIGKGVYRSTDGGRTWTHLGLERAGQQDNTAICVPVLPPAATPPDAPEAWWRVVAGCETGPAVPRPGEFDVVYGNCNKGQFSRSSFRPAAVPTPGLDAYARQA